MSEVEAAAKQFWRLFRSPMQMTDDVLTLDKARMLVDTLETLYPRKKMAKCAKLSQRTFSAVRDAYSRLAGHDVEVVTATWGGLPLYVDNNIRDGMIRIYNLDDEVIHQIRTFPPEIEPVKA